MRMSNSLALIFFKAGLLILLLGNLLSIILDGLPQCHLNPVHAVFFSTMMYPIQFLLKSHIWHLGMDEYAHCL